MQRLVLIGHNGNANDIIDVVDVLRRHGIGWELLGYLDDAGPSRGCLRQLPYLGRIADARHWLPSQFLLAIGSERTYLVRERIFHKSGLDEANLCRLVHPLAQVSQTVQVGLGTVIHYGCYVGSSVMLDTGVYLAPLVHVGHDTFIGAWSVLAPGAIVCGNVRLDKSVYVGAGSMILSGVRVGRGALIGMGAVVTKDVPEYAVIVGNPGRVLRLQRNPTANTEESDMACLR